MCQPPSTVHGIESRTTVKDAALELVRMGQAISFKGGSEWGGVKSGTVRSPRLARYWPVSAGSSGTVTAASSGYRGEKKTLAAHLGTCVINFRLVFVPV